MVKGYKDIKGFKSEQEAKLAVEKVEKSRRKLWRYHCEACTGRATYAVEPYVFTSIGCENCGASCAYEAQNWIKVTDKNELAKINAPELQSEV